MVRATLVRDFEGEPRAGCLLDRGFTQQQVSKAVEDLKPPRAVLPATRSEKEYNAEATLGHPQNDESSAMLDRQRRMFSVHSHWRARRLYEFPRNVKGKYDSAELEAFDKEAR
jgi:hypothetical protein